ncbi:fatty-acyl-CoA synthase [Phenylobacterium haematophilum]|uniref:Fatty-acyl-CoA synthase n=1 Tax=Phenylobacterium haematophilum TaxID=98513 RepID=A0A839ZWK3_9CAUL|nr:acyl-CoA synthetase [Phenylobacterium haematophilum]MBB3890424.1 fatty-acyl-CoA synthase [Phenylobacterium haematophilum]
MYLADHARLTPDKPAMISADTGRAVTFAELNERSNRLAQFLYAQGLRRGDHIAVLMENNLAFMEPVWAAFRSGLYVTTINRYLPADEAAYIASDCGAKALITSYAKRDTAAELLDLIPNCPIRLMVGGVIPGWASYEDAVASCSPEPLAQEWMGDSMLYSSGTTGRPKGILRPLPEITPAEGFETRQASNRYELSAQSVYLSPAPLYHAAPLAYVLTVQSFGGTVVMMERFDPEQALHLIEKHRVTHSQWVPTMFVRMLKLPPEVRTRYDLSSHKVAVHAAAPCPVEVKRQMIEWWGPILYEYYAGTEASGSTFITSEDWLKHPGSVGRAALGVLHICDEDGNELPVGETGLVYFEREAPTFEYHNDPAKTASARHPKHPNWNALGDVGYLDEDGYLYLTDRKAFMIISGGVNIYPQAIEDALVTHPKVADVAVFGVPDPEMGEAVKAVIEPAPGQAPSDDLAAELMTYARERLAHYMAPRSIDFIQEMPRLPTGKLYKRILRDAYWQDRKI